MGLRLIIELKGQYTDDADSKAKAAERWFSAVNTAGDWGAWYDVVVKDPTELPNKLNAYCAAQWDVALPEGLPST